MRIHPVITGGRPCTLIAVERSPTHAAQRRTSHTTRATTTTSGASRVSKMIANSSGPTPNMSPTLTLAMAKLEELPS